MAALHGWTRNWKKHFHPSHGEHGRSIGMLHRGFIPCVPARVIWRAIPNRQMRSGTLGAMATTWSSVSTSSWSENAPRPATTRQLTFRSPIDDPGQVFAQHFGVLRDGNFRLGYFWMPFLFPFHGKPPIVALGVQDR